MQKNMIFLKEQDLPTQWLNIKSVLPEKLPPLKEPNDDRGSRLETIKKIRTKAMLEQDGTEEKWVNIPGEVLDKYIQVGRSTPLMRAVELEHYLDTPAKIYIKREDFLPTHSFKLNTAIPQAYYAKKENVKGLISETGAGQWGLSLSYACNMFDVETIVFWVRISMEQKPFRKYWSEMLGGKIYPSPSSLTSSGRVLLEENPNSYGSLGTAIGDAISYTLENEGYKYASGSNLNHVLLHQSVIGLETYKQLEIAGDMPDTVIACCGGGSNLGGIMAPFIQAKVENPSKIKLLAVESNASPRLCKGEYKYDFSDPVGITPLTLSYTMGHDFMPPASHVGGLRQHNGSPMVGLLRHKEILDAVAYDQEEIFEAGKLFTKLYGSIPAPETCHAIKATIDEALSAKINNEKKTILMCFSGNGLLDLNGYIEVLGKK